MKLSECFYKRSYTINIIACLLLVVILIAVCDFAYEKVQYSKPFMVLENIDFSKANEYAGKLNIAFETETNTEALIVLGTKAESNSEDFDAEFCITSGTDGKNYYKNQLVTPSECYYNGTKYNCMYFSGIPAGIHDFKLVIKKPSKTINNSLTIMIIPICEFLGLKIQILLGFFFVLLLALLAYNLIHFCYKCPTTKQ